MKKNKILSILLSIIIIGSLFSLPLSVNAAITGITIDKWEIGNYNINTGEKEGEDAGKYIRTADYIDVSQYKLINIELDESLVVSSYKWNIHFFDDNYNFITSGYNRFISTTESSCVKVLGKYATISILKNEISPEEGSCISFFGSTPRFMPLDNYCFNWVQGRYNADTGNKENESSTYCIRTNDLIDARQYDVLKINYNGSYSWNIHFFDEYGEFIKSTHGQYAYASAPDVVPVEGAAFTVSVYKSTISPDDGSKIFISGKKLSYVELNEDTVLDWTEGRYNANNGEKEYETSGYCIRTKDLIDVSKYDDLLINYSGSYSWNVHFFDECGQFISSAYDQYAYASTPSTVPVKGKFATISIYKPSIKVEEGANISLKGDTKLTGTITINKNYLKAGEPLLIDNPDNYDLKYYVNGNKVNDTDFVLKSDYYEKWIKVVGYQNNKRVAEDKVYFSKLPVLYIDTEDGSGITSKEEYKKANFVIQNNKKTDKSIYSGSIDIRGRGNTTWRLFPKKPYKVKLNKKTDLFGMGKSKHWVLLANYLDNSYMRYKNAQRIADKLNVDAMDSVWTDLILNGQYIGAYQLCEQVKIDKTRVNIFDWESEAEDLANAVCKAEKAKGNTLDSKSLENALVEDLSWVTTGTFTFDNITYQVSDYYTVQQDLSGGYLFESSEEYDEVSRFTTNNGLKIMLKSPEFLNTNSEMMNYVESYWNDFEKAYRSEDGYTEINGKKVHYSELANLDSMVGYWLVVEIMGNNDAVYKSRYIYKETGKPLVFGPIWDYDYGCGSCTVGNKPTGWKVTTASSEEKKYANIYKEFIDDPLFASIAVEKYWQIRPYLQTLIEDGGVVDQDISYLTEAGIADNALWDRHKTYSFARTYEEDASIFKSYLKNRINWLDAQFKDTNTLLNSTRTSASAYPYTNSNDIIKITFNNTNEDVSDYAVANGVIGSNSDLSVNVDIRDEATKNLKVYVNGLYNSTANIVDGKTTLNINKTTFTKPYNENNVISFIGTDENNKTTYKTFNLIKTFYEEETTPVVSETESETLISPVSAEKIGDADNDGTVTVSDCTIVQRYVVGIISELDNEFLLRCDVNKDAKVNIRDATLIQMYIAKIIPSFDAFSNTLQIKLSDYDLFDDLSFNNVTGTKLNIKDANTNEVLVSWEVSKSLKYIDCLVEGKEYLLCQESTPSGYSLEQGIRFKIARIGDNLKAVKI